MISKWYERKRRKVTNP